MKNRSRQEAAADAIEARLSPDNCLAWLASANDLALPKLAAAAKLVALKRFETVVSGDEALKGVADDRLTVRGGGSGAEEAVHSGAAAPNGGRGGRARALWRCALRASMPSCSAASLWRRGSTRSRCCGRKRGSASLRAPSSGTRTVCCRGTASGGASTALVLPRHRLRRSLYCIGGGDDGRSVQVPFNCSVTTAAWDMP